MMLKILKDRFIRLGRDEDGVAFVITLGVFMFLYVACASVYAVGMAVKEKMHLQGACDAAAYSAAIVQADTFSRIATINRAMSWTYQQMTKRQMDYIVWQWLEETVDHYDDDALAAAGYVRSSLSRRCPYSAILSQKGIGWDISPSIRINGNRILTRDQIVSICGQGAFGRHLQSCSGSFYSQRSRNLLGDGGKRCGLGMQIDDDLRNIRDMSDAVVELARRLPRHVEDAVEGILAANIPSYMHNGDCQYFIQQSLNPIGQYIQIFPNTPYHELVFLSLGNGIYTNASQAFDTGTDDWFVLDAGAPDGFRRHYPRNRAAGPLVSEWEWWAIRWQCRWDPVRRRHYDIRANVAAAGNCSHPRDGNCTCSGSGTMIFPQIRNASGILQYSNGSTVRAMCRANNNGRYGYDNRFDSRVGGRIVRAMPLRLTPAYFGTNGTITVGLARRNENPWFSIFGRVTGGMYSAFSPVADSWTFCFASAKAGYKLYHEPNDFYINANLGSKRRTRKLDDWEEKLNGNVRVENGPRDYCIDWKEEESKFAGWYWEYKKNESGRYVRDRNGRRIRETLVTQWTAPSELNPSWRQSWNLVQDDWDAVMIPVRQGGSRAEEVDRWKEDHGQEWDAFWWDWMRQLRHRSRGYRGYESAKDRYPVRYEPVWQPGGAGNLALMLKNPNWQRISGRGRSVPNTSVTAGPTYGDRGDPLGGRLAGQIWDDHWRRGIPPPTATGTSQWNIGSPGANLDWNQIENEMYH